MFALVDVNSFYASCETVFRPDLWGQPVAVLSNNDGCVIACNAQARRLGLKTGDPYFKLGEYCRAHGVHVFSSNYTLYADISHRVMTILEEMAPATEIYSIDESWLLLQGMARLMPLEEYGRRVQARVQKEAHVTVGVGIAQTKTLAKLANHAAKRWRKTGGVVDLSDPLRQRKLMALVPVSDVWGIGGRLSKRLMLMGIHTALDLAQAHTGLIRKQFGVVLERTVRELRGESCLALELEPAAKQQIVCSRSFGHRLTAKEEVRQAVCAFAERAAEKLRGERRYCRQVTVFIRTSPHDAQGDHYTPHATAQCQTPTQDTRDIIALAMQAFERIWLEGYRYMKAGVMLGDFYNEGVAQFGLFDELVPRANSEALMQVVDHLNRTGKGSLWFAGQGVQKSWQMRRAMLSPAYTTRFADLPVVK
ncbi:translesion error-prone DNA polymerase V subunit UmuC [Chimaeribacter arupi]|uniref:translesion error-prone DNA polymerase V subunit UmuC n=1 Tax=Chimaeribacter arupi TaxID=2060066 RepID=UPI000C7E2B20|nr:translesion error-prone DNA polymerase V subunit UmuC [Chimaeribacter arupi]PLR37810.1 DNA polymerase V subunit UmuC [Chimaeribacter arupi]